MDDHVSKPLQPEKLRERLRGLGSLGKATGQAGLTEVLPAVVPAAAALAAADSFEAEGYDPAATLTQTEDWVIEAIGEAFLADCDGLLADLTAAVVAEDAAWLVRGAHTLRGLYGSFQAAPLEALAAQIEAQAAAGAFAAAARTQQQLTAGNARLVAALRNRVERVSAASAST